MFFQKVKGDQNGITTPGAGGGDISNNSILHIINNDNK